MENSKTACPVCTLFLREGVTLQAHLDTHPKEQVIEALLKVSNGGSVTQVPNTSASTSSFVPVQSITNSNSSFMSQSPQTLLSINPQSQMTTAVTYQHIMTSNGSAIMPQYIQVPFVNPGGSVPVISNSMNLVPNQTVNYSQTAYNPLYNPYIPQPYPFTQPIFTSLPISAYPVIDSNIQTQNSNSTNNGVGTLLQSSVLVEKCSIATSTDVNKRNAKIKCKKTYLRRAATRRKLKLIKQKPNESKASSSLLRLSAAKLRKQENADASSSTKSRMISPPPLMPITKSKTNSIPSSGTPSPPPLSKAPYFEIVNVDKGEDVNDSEVSPAITDCINNNNNNNSSNNKQVGYMGQHHKSKSVIVDSDSMSKCNNNEGEDSKEQEEIKMLSDNTNNNMEESESINESSKDPLELSDTVNECNEISEINEITEEVEEEGEDEVDEIQEKVFEMIEVTEDCKIDIINTVTNQDIPKEISSENIERNCDGSDIFIQQENILFSEDSLRERTNENSYSEFVDVQTVEPIENQNSSKENQNEFGFYNEGEENVNSKNVDSQPVTYTDLQPAKSSRVFQDLDISPYLSFNNYMEVDGIKIFFNNSSTNLPFDSVMKLTNLQSTGRNMSTVMKSENQVSNHGIVDSVIQIVPGEESKGDLTFRENYTATTSQVNDIQLDLPDLSPLALNIQADESMPARGELSEQESLGAENSSWNLFHGNSINDTKALEAWRNENLHSVSVIGDKKASKSFKCSTCNEVFSCPKERRVHKNTVHLNKTEKTDKSSTPKKPKTYACSSCSEVFTSFRDRKLHFYQCHYPNLKNKNISQIKEENAESVNLERAEVKNETETKQENNVKTEEAVPPPEVESHQIKYCTRCSLPLMGMKKFREHLRLVHGEVRFKCESCSICFDEEHEYNDHLLIHPLVCDKCGKTFRRKPNLNLHMKRHLEVKPHKCSLCPKSFITRQKLEEHMNGHSGKKPIKCTLCDKTFSRHSNLIQHRNIHHLNVKKKIKDFVCRCGEVFHSLRKLEWHKEVHDPKPKPCPFCSQKFIHSASVTRHIRRAHLPNYLPGDNREIDNIQCPICEKVYLRSSLVVHMRVHNGEKPFACKICNKRFSTKWNLELHNWTHQSRSNMPYKCTICKSAFFRETDFVAHANAHRNYKPFTCNVCGQKFIRKYSCLRHQREHKKTKQYVCGVNGCAKSFHRGYYLRDHMKVHTGLRPHTCHICGKASSTKSNHNKHVRIHDTREPVNTEN